MCYLSTVFWPFPSSSKSFVNFRLSSTRLLIKWFLIKKRVPHYTNYFSEGGFKLDKFNNIT